VIIPRISKNVPVVTISSEALINRDWGKLEQQIQEALRDGVVHYPSTAFPDEEGNMVITGHSSYFTWDPGRFKDVFALLHDVQIGDKLYVYHDQNRYDYEVFDTKIVLPTQVDVLTQEGADRLTLITCTPVGTNLKRLVVLARPV
jgi:sortase A